MSANAGGVRNLRAMFENKTSDQSNSPPSRGRSPSDSAASASSRQVSKVRASFVAVERPGDLSQGPQWGLRKASDVSSMAEVREDMDNDLAPKSPHSTEQPIDGGLGTILKGSSFERPPKKEPAVEPKVNDMPKKQEPQANGITSRAAAMVEKMKSNDKSQPPPTTTLKTTSADLPVKPLPPKHIPATQSPSSPKAKSPKTPTSPSAPRLNIRGGPAKVRSVMESARQANEAREAYRKEQTVKSPVTTKPQPSPKPTAPMSTATREVKKAAPEPIQKPAPKPRISAVSGKLPSVVTASTTAREAHKATAEAKTATKPKSSAPSAKLPSAITAKTAASAAKTDAPPPVRKAASRPSMGLAKVPSAATAGTASTLAKKSSRASLANGGDRPRSRVSTGAKPDESFLARMARPTVSSASKTHEKTEVVKTKTASRAPRKSDQSQATVSEEDISEEPGMPSASAHQEDAVSPQQAEVFNSHISGARPGAPEPAKVENA